MQVWIKIKLDREMKHLDSIAIELEERIFDRAIANGVLCARGSWFRVASEEPMRDISFRITFASAEEDAMRIAVQRLSVAVREALDNED